MLTKKEFKQLERLIRKALRDSYKTQNEDLRLIEKRLDLLERNIIAQQMHSQKAISKKIDKLQISLERFVRIQEILERKMREVENYFDPHPKN